VKAAMTSLVQLPTGAVMKVFTDKGKPIKAIEDFEDEARYIAAGPEKLDKDLSMY
jgi:hypothetical protein